MYFTSKKRALRIVLLPVFIQTVNFLFRLKEMLSSLTQRIFGLFQLNLRVSKVFLSQL